jgi:hypothetical protein
MSDLEAVWVMLYHHRHGIDFSVYEQEVDAWAATRDIIDQYLADYQGEDDAATIAAIRKHLAGEDAEVNLYTLWAELSEESFEIEKRSIVRATEASGV